MFDAPRLEVFSMSLNDKDMDIRNDSDSDTENDNPIDFKGPISIFISDQVRVREIYNSVKLDKFYTPLLGHDSDGTITEDWISGHDSDFPLTRQYVEEVELGDDTGLPLTGEELHDSVCSHEGNSISLPLTGPEGDIVPWGIFDVIVHQGTGDPKTDESDLKVATPLYLDGIRSKRSDVVYTYQLRSLFYYNRIIPLNVRGPFGSLTLDCAVFMDSRLVTVDPKWFLESIGDGNIDNGTDSYICGELSFYTSELDVRSVLFKTPAYKGKKVQHGESIPLLKSKVAVPICEFFTVEANLHDPINNTDVSGSATFYFDDDFVIEKRFCTSKNIVGSGAKIKVAVTMAPNDPPYLLSGSPPKDVSELLLDFGSGTVVVHALDL